MSKKALYKRTDHCVKEGWLIEAPFICLPPGTKHWYKKYLSRRERYKAKRGDTDAE